MTISVVIPTYNYAQFLAQAIDSVLAQTFRPLEIIVADDGSTDNTKDVVAQYGDKIVYRYFEHRGICAIRQDLLTEIKGEWFFNLDADDWIEPDFLERMQQCVVREKDEKLAFVYPDKVYFGAYRKKVCAPEFDVNLFKKGNFVVMNSLVKTNAARETGFDSTFNAGWEDYDFFLGLSKRGCTGKHLPGLCFHCRAHVSSRTAIIIHDTERMQNLMKKIVKKHHDFFSPEDARQAIEHFSPNAVLRGRICELFLARQYVEGCRMLCRLAITRPAVIFSMTAVKRCVFDIIRRNT